MTAPELTTHPNLSKIENFLFFEANLLDEWRLEEWLALFTSNATYIVPSLDVEPVDAITLDPRTTLCLVHDNMTIMRSRVRRLLDKRAHAANPHARTRHILSNIRATANEEGLITVRSNYLVSSASHDGLDLYVGGYVHRLTPHEGSFRIQERRAILDLHSLTPMGAVNFIL